MEDLLQIIYEEYHEILKDGELISDDGVNKMYAFSRYYGKAVIFGNQVNRTKCRIEFSAHVSEVTLVFDSDSWFLKK